MAWRTLPCLVVKLLWPTGDQGWGGQLASLWSGGPPKASSHSAPGPPPAEPLATPSHCPAHPPLLEAVPRSPPPGGRPPWGSLSPGAAPWPSLTALASPPSPHRATPPNLVSSRQPACFDTESTVAALSCFVPCLVSADSEVLDLIRGPADGTSIPNSVPSHRAPAQGVGTC